MDGFATSYAQVEARLNHLEDVPSSSVPKLLFLSHLPFLLFLRISQLRLRFLVIPGITRRLLHSLHLTHIPAPGGADSGSVPRIHPLKTDIDSFRSAIDNLRYILTNRAAYIDPNADLSLQKLKLKVELLYTSLEAFYIKNPLKSWDFWLPRRKHSTINAVAKV